jgi:predicted phage terminase large subunit-like protein
VKITAEVVEGFSTSLLKKSFDDPAPTPQCHREWWAMFCSERKFVAIAAPRGHAKSTALTHAFTLAAICFREKSFILIVSDTETQSTFFLNDIKKELTENEDLIKMFGIKGLTKDSISDFIIEFTDGTQARVIAKGSGQSLRGVKWNNKRPDLIVGDDLESDEQVMNKERREKFRRWFTGALLPCRSKDGCIRLVGTILHMDSLLERYMPKQWAKSTTSTPLKDISSSTAIWYSARYRAHPGPGDFSQILWPDYKDEAWLRAEQQSYRDQGLGDVYVQEYLNQPIDEANALFRIGDFTPLKNEDRDGQFNYYISMDLAVSTKNRSDWSVFMVGRTDSQNVLQIVDVVRKRLDSLEIVDAILFLNQAYSPDFFVCEKGTIASSILPMLKQKMVEENNFVNLQLITPSTDKVQRSNSIRARMRAGNVKFDKDADWFPELEQECIRFPRDRHDDQVDALSYLGLSLNLFVESKTKQESEEDEYEDEWNNSGIDISGRSQITGY